MKSEELDLHDKTHNKDNLEEDCDCCNRCASHIERALRSKEQYQFDSNLTKTDIIVYSVDVQEVFTQRIVVYNESLLPNGARIGPKDSSIYSIIWYEAFSGRSTDEIIRVYYYFLSLIRI